MIHPRCAVTILVSLLLLPMSARSIDAQDQDKARAALSVTTSSTEAREAFWAGLAEIANIHFARGAQHLQRAMQLDPKFGLARVLYASQAPGLTTEQRNQEFERGLSDLVSNGSTGEILFGLAWRAPVQERGALLDAALKLLPEDPYIAYYRATTVSDIRERARALEEVTRRFPDFGPAYNLLAYARFRDLGDKAGGLAAVQQYVRTTPAHPNSHDSYAELLAWSGRLDEAEQHYRQAVELDPNYGEGYNGLAEVALLRGNYDAARAHYQKARELAQTPQAGLNVRQALAMTYVAEGKIAAARNELTTVASEAEQNNFPAVAAQAHRTLALVEAAFGNKNAVHGHLDKAAQLFNPEAPAQLGFSAIAHAFLGQLDAARTAADKFVAAMTLPNATPGQARNAASMRGIMAAAQGNVETALSEARLAAQAGALPKLFAAEQLKKARKTSEARQLGREIQSMNEVDVLTILAKQRARKL